MSRTALGGSRRGDRSSGVETGAATEVTEKSLVHLESGWESQRSGWLSTLVGRWPG